MGALSNCLKDVINEVYEGKQANLAEASGLPTSLISRYCSGGFRPDLAKLDQLCAALKPDVRARIAVAHLQDECPRSARSWVRIEPSSDQGVTFTEPSHLPNLDRRTRAAMEFLADIALNDKHAQQALISTARFLGMKT